MKKQITQQPMMDYKLFLLLILSGFVFSYCVPPPREIPVSVIVVTETPSYPQGEGSAPPSSDGSPPETPVESVPNISAELPIDPLFVTADAPDFNGCTCNGVPVGVNVTLHVSGGLPPYTLDGYDNRTFTDSYVIPVDKNIKFLTLVIRSGDGQKDDVRIEIPSCVPPPNCDSDDLPANNNNSNPNNNSGNLLTNLPSTDPPPNDTKVPPRPIDTMVPPQPTNTPCPTTPSGNIPPGQCK